MKKKTTQAPTSAQTAAGSPLGNAATAMYRVAVLHPAARNPNTMEPEEYAVLKAAIKELNDLPQPLLITPHLTIPDEYEIVDGYHRWLAASELGFTEVPCVFRNYSAEEREAVRLGMNRNRGHIDLRIARDVVQDLLGEGWSSEQLVITGFSEAQLAELEGAVDHSTAKDLLKDAASAAGDIDDSPETAAKAFVLEIPFVNKRDMVAARRALKKAAGATKDLSRGLLNALGLEKA